MRRILGALGITLAGVLLAGAAYSLQSDRLAAQQTPPPSGPDVSHATVQPVVVVRHEKPRPRPAPVIVTAPAPAPAPVVAPVTGATSGATAATAPVVQVRDDRGGDDGADDDEHGDDRAEAEHHERHEDHAEREQEHDNE